MCDSRVPSLAQDCPLPSGRSMCQKENLETHGVMVNMCVFGCNQYTEIDCTRKTFIA